MDVDRMFDSSHPFKKLFIRSYKKIIIHKIKFPLITCISILIFIFLAEKLGTRTNANDIELKY